MSFNWKAGYVVLTKRTSVHMPLVVCQYQEVPFSPRISESFYTVNLTKTFLESVPPCGGSRWLEEPERADLLSSREHSDMI